MKRTVLNGKHTLAYYSKTEEFGTPAGLAQLVGLLTAKRDAADAIPRPRPILRVLK